MDSWDDDVLYSPDPAEHRERRALECAYGHPDRTALGYCRAECERMIDGLVAQRVVARTRGDKRRAMFLGRAIVLWQGRLA